MTYQWQTTEFAGLTAAELYTALQLRQEVFILEQNCLYPDLDDLDQSAVHILCWHGNELLAYQRCLAPGAHFEESAIGRIVVGARARGHKLGGELVTRAIRHNLQRWQGHNIRISAQAHLQAFYGGLGFVSHGDVYDEDGIAHIQMVYTRPD